MTSILTVKDLSVTLGGKQIIENVNFSVGKITHDGIFGIGFHASVQHSHPKRTQGTVAQIVIQVQNRCGLVRRLLSIRA